MSLFRAFRTTLRSVETVGSRRFFARTTICALVKVSPLLELAPDWRRLLTSAVLEKDLRELRKHERTGRPLGDDDFLVQVEQNLGRVLRRRKPGPKTKRVAN